MMADRSMEEDLNIDRSEMARKVENALMCCSPDNPNLKTSSTDMAHRDCPLTIISLREAVDTWDPDQLDDLMGSFTSEDAEAVVFLKNYAIITDEESIARTYLFVVSEPEINIVGFFTIGTSHLSFANLEHLPPKLLSLLNISEQTGTAPTYLIAQACVSRDSPLDLDSVIGTAMSYIDQVRKNVGCRLVRMDCTDCMKDRLTRLGFTFIRKDSSGTLNQMICVMSPDC